MKVTISLSKEQINALRNAVYSQVNHSQKDERKLLLSAFHRLNDAVKKTEQRRNK